MPGWAFGLNKMLHPDARSWLQKPGFHRKAALIQISAHLRSGVLPRGVPKQTWVSGASQAGLRCLEGLCDPGQSKGHSWCIWPMA